MRPDDLASLRLARRFNEMCPANFVITVAVELRDDQIALLIGQKEAVLVFHDKGVRPSGGLSAGGLKRLPQAVSIPGIESSQFTVAVDTKDQVVLEPRGAHDAV